MVCAQMVPPCAFNILDVISDFVPILNLDNPGVANTYVSLKRRPHKVTNC